MGLLRLIFASDSVGPLSLWDKFLLKVEFVPLLSMWWVVGFGVATLFFLVLAIVVRPRWWLLLFVPLTLLSIVLGVALSFNIHFHVYKTLGPALGLNPYDSGSADLISHPTGEYHRGVVVSTTIPGKAAGLGDLPAKVWLPPQYFTEKNRTFPVIVLLHGVPGVTVPGISKYSGPDSLFTQVAADDGAQQAAIKKDQPTILIAPVDSPMDADTECVDGIQGKWQTYLAKDVPDWIAGHRRMQTGAEHTAIAGYSMGGYCAQMTALRNPSVYSVSGNLSGASAASHDRGPQALWGNDNLVKRQAEYDSTVIVKTQPASHSVRLWLTIGESDHSEPGLIESQQEFAQVARQQGMTVVQQTMPGDHTFAVWSKAMLQWLPWTIAQLYGQSP